MALSYTILAVCLLSIFNIEHVHPADIVVKGTCSDALTLYADGVDKGTHNSKTSAKTYNIPANTNVVAMKCTANPSSTTKAGILASFQMEYAGDFVTDATWKCTGSYVAGWSDTNFDDVNWLYAKAHGDNANSVPSGLSSISAISSHAKWIWTSLYATSYGDLTVYCRATIGISKSMDNYGRKFAIGFVDNYVVSSNQKGIKLLITTLKPTDVTVYCFTPHITSGSSKLSEVRTVSAGNIVSIKPSSSLRNNGDVANGDKSILCVSTEAVKIVGENQEQHSSDLFLTIPINALGVESDSLTYYSVHWDDSMGGYDQRLLIVSAFDSTSIKITPKDSVTYSSSRSANVQFTITLNKYRCAQIGGSAKDLTGSKIVSNKPIAVYSGNKKTKVLGSDYSSTSADHLIEQLVPTKNWGKDFSITPLPSGGNYRQVKHLAWYVIVAADASTTITIKNYDSAGTLKDTITQTKHAGQYYKYNHPKQRSATITASKGIMVAQFATTKQGAECLGDPWLQLIPPIYGFEKDYTILPPVLSEKSGCTNVNFFTVIVKTSEKADVLVDTEPIGSITNNQIVTLGWKTIPGTIYSYQTVQIPAGEHRIQHKKPNVALGCYYFGYGSLDSYASMGGTRMAPINEPCTNSNSQMGDGIDNDCDGEIDEDICSSPDPNKDCASPSPVDGGWSNWSSAGPCVCSSGNTGTQPFTRVCNNPTPKYNGRYCSGTDNKQEACTCVPINGGWSNWSAYGQCSTTCDDGIKIRTRSCTNPFPANGGADCSGSRNDNATCIVANCPINGGFSSWQDSTTCSCAAGTSSGTKTQTRSCTNPSPQYGGAACSGANSQTVNCNCPLDGGWSNWAAWGSCSETCGNGTKTRSRTCTNPTPVYGGANCTGDPTSSDICFVTNCPINGGWSSWGSWSVSCSCSSGTDGTKTRQRTCTNPSPQYNGVNCPSQGSESRSCVCTSGLNSIVDYEVNEYYTLVSNGTKSNRTLTECHQNCESDPSCVGYSYLYNNDPEKCRSYTQADVVTQTDNSSVSILVIKKSALTTTTTSTSTSSTTASLNANGAQAVGGDETATSTTVVAAAVGGGVGGVAAIAAGAAIYVARRRKKKKEEEEAANAPKSTEANDMEVDDYDADADDFNS